MKTTNYLLAAILFCLVIQIARYEKPSSIPATQDVRITGISDYVYSAKGLPVQMVQSSEDAVQVQIVGSPQQIGTNGYWYRSKAQVGADGLKIELSR